MSSEPGELLGLRILVVEDSFLVADSICEVLSEHGCRVVGPAASLQRGSQLAREEALDGAVLDVNLAGELSFPIARALAERSIPFLFLTGYDDISVMPPEHRAVDRLTKPFDFGELVAKVGGFRSETGTTPVPSDKFDASPSGSGPDRD